jgi:hypothetical protein
VNDAFEEVQIRKPEPQQARHAVHDSFRSWNVFVIDEVSMVTRTQFEAIHTFLKDTVGWNGVLLLMGNVPQLACVVKGGTPGNVIANHMSSSTVLRQELRRSSPITFTTLMRTADAADLSYRGLCWKIGYRLSCPDDVLDSNDMMQLIRVPRHVLPSAVCTRSTVLQGMKWLFPEFFQSTVTAPTVPSTDACFVTNQT